jgi:CubicO group peptidase (beta-lactamase class C family)
VTTKICTFISITEKSPAGSQSASKAPASYKLFLAMHKRPPIAAVPSLPRVADFMSAAIADGALHSAVWGAGGRDGLRFVGVHGLAVPAPEAIPATPDTVYDLASLTKPLVTGLLAAMFVERQELDPYRTLGDYLPEFHVGDFRDAPLWRTLAHCAGFPAWRPLYALADDPRDALRTIARMPCAYAPETRVIYSDLGFIALGAVLERIAGMRLDALFEAEVAAPLGLRGARFNPPPEWRPRIASTEVGNGFERELAARLEGLTPSERARVDGFSAWRTSLIWGEAHDGNAHFLGGVSGHAGLFAPLRDVFALASQFLPGGVLLREETLAQFSRSLTPGLDEERTFAWATRLGGLTAGASFSPKAFGHVGFAGTSLWIDPTPERVYILLANRTYPIRQDLNAVRRDFHAHVAAAFQN